MDKNRLWKLFGFPIAFLLLINFVKGQGLNIPAKHIGISIGNSTSFTGLRFNYIDKNIQKINGINFSIWNTQEEDHISGTINGLSIGLPMAYGSNFRNGVSVGIFGAGAQNSTSGIQLGGLGVGAGENLSGINISGLATGAGNNVNGINVGGLAVGAGGDIKGINIGGLAVGTGRNLIGINIAGLVVGSGETIKGINMAGLVVGSGEKLQGISIAGLVAGSERIEGLTLAPMAGGAYVTGLAIAPLYFTIRHDPENIGYMKGMSISAFNDIKGEQRGLTIGLLNIANNLKGLQIGLINIAKSNRKGLKVLPFFNAPFH